MTHVIPLSLNPFDLSGREKKHPALAALPGICDKRRMRCTDRPVGRVVLEFLEAHRMAVVSAYRSSPYLDETSFSEYLMCWYRFLYTAVTNRLRDQRVIKIVTYFVVPKPG